jgi:hypothetical protein
VIEQGGRTPAKRAVVTIAAKNYWPRVRVLARSIAQLHPELAFFAVLTDEVDGCFDAAREAFGVVRLEELPLPPGQLRRMSFALARRELAAAVKASALRHLLDGGFSEVVLIDPDCLALRPLEPLWDALGRTSILLSPHRTRPKATADRVAADLRLLSAGTFNGGLLGVREGRAARRFLAWWADRTQRCCKGRLERGLHYDQRWLDLVPGLFEDVLVFRDPDFNVAYWNLDDRLGGDAGADGSGPGPRTWRLFHFSGFDPARGDEVSAYAPGLRMSEMPGLEALFESYCGQLLAEGQGVAERWGYAFGTFDNGVPIPDVVRDVYDDMGPSAERFGDPFAADAHRSFLHWLGRPAGPGLPAIPNLWRELHASRPDLQSRFPDPAGRDRVRFVAWTKTRGFEEYALPEAFRRAIA